MRAVPKWGCANTSVRRTTRSRAGAKHADIKLALTLAFALALALTLFLTFIRAHCFHVFGRVFMWHSVAFHLGLALTFRTRGAGKLRPL